jgi:hypothetical protein
MSSGLDALSPTPIGVDEEVLDDLRSLLRATIWPGDEGNEDGRYGVPRALLQELAELVQPHQHQRPPPRRPLHPVGDPRAVDRRSGPHLRSPARCTAGVTGRSAHASGPASASGSQGRRCPPTAPVSSHLAGAHVGAYDDQSMRVERARSDSALSRVCAEIVQSV